MRMNKTEVRAKEWLESQGYGSLAFQNRNSPDFITDKGLGFEVKKLRENTVFFSTRQWRQLEIHPNVTILVFDSKETPEAIIPFRQLDKPPSYWGKYRLVMKDLEKTRYKAEARHFKALREELGISQAELARKMGVTFQTVNRWENGKTRPSALARRLIEEIARKLHPAV